MKFIGEVGDNVIYNGKICLRPYMVWMDLYRYLKKGKLYRIEEVFTFTKDENYTYYKLEVKNAGPIWYPKESFFIDKRMKMAIKYKLK